MRGPAGSVVNDRSAIRGVRFSAVWAPVARRNVIGYVPGDRTDAIGWNDVPRERCPVDAPVRPHYGRVGIVDLILRWEQSLSSRVALAFKSQ